jgi:hypothetical protein
MRGCKSILHWFSGAQHSKPLLGRSVTTVVRLSSAMVSCYRKSLLPTNFISIEGLFFYFPKQSPDSHCVDITGMTESWGRDEATTGTNKCCQHVPIRQVPISHHNLLNFFPSNCILIVNVTNGLPCQKTDRGIADCDTMRLPWIRRDCIPASISFH